MKRETRELVLLVVALIAIGVLGTWLSLLTGCAGMLTEVATDVLTNVIDESVPPLVTQAIDEAAEKMGPLITQTIDEATQKLTGPETPVGTLLGSMAGMLTAVGSWVVYDRRRYHGAQSRKAMSVKLPSQNGKASGG